MFKKLIIAAVAAGMMLVTGCSSSSHSDVMVTTHSYCVAGGSSFNFTTYSTLE